MPSSRSRRTTRLTGRKSTPKHKLKSRRRRLRRRLRASLWPAARRTTWTWDDVAHGEVVGAGFALWNALDEATRNAGAIGMLYGTSALGFAAELVERGIHWVNFGEAFVRGRSAQLAGRSGGQGRLDQLEARRGAVHATALVAVGFSQWLVHQAPESWGITVLAVLAALTVPVMWLAAGLLWATRDVVALRARAGVAHKGEQLATSAYAAGGLAWSLWGVAGVGFVLTEAPLFMTLKTSFLVLGGALFALGGLPSVAALPSQWRVCWQVRADGPIAVSARRARERAARRASAYLRIDRRRPNWRGTLRREVERLQAAAVRRGSRAVRLRQTRVQRYVDATRLCQAQQYVSFALWRRSARETLSAVGSVIASVGYAAWSFDGGVVLTVGATLMLAPVVQRFGHDVAETVYAAHVTTRVEEAILGRLRSRVQRVRAVMRRVARPTWAHDRLSFRIAERDRRSEQGQRLRMLRRRAAQDYVQLRNALGGLPREQHACHLVLLARRPQRAQRVAWLVARDLLGTLGVDPGAPHAVVDAAARLRA